MDQHQPGPPGPTLVHINVRLHAGGIEGTPDGRRGYRREQGSVTEEFDQECRREHRVPTRS